MYIRVWQHVDCMEVDHKNIPDSYMCELCEPRPIDKHRAILIQTRKRDDLCTYFLHTHTHTPRLTVLFLSGTTRVGRYQKGKTNLDFTEARDGEWQWHQLGLKQVCTLLHADNQASTPALIFYRPVALPFAQPTMSKYIFTVCSWIMPLISLCTYRAHTVLSSTRLRNFDSFNINLHASVGF